MGNTVATARLSPRRAREPRFHRLTASYDRGCSTRPSEPYACLAQAPTDKTQLVIVSPCYVFLKQSMLPGKSDPEEIYLNPLELTTSVKLG